MSNGALGFLLIIVAVVICFGFIAVSVGHAIGDATFSAKCTQAGGVMVTDGSDRLCVQKTAIIQVQQ